MNDRHINDKMVDYQDAEGGVELAVFRLPSVWSTSRRFKQAKQWIDNIDPDWLSLQYVPFGFQQKGLPFGLSNYLKQVGSGRKWHIMFHELWVGMDEKAPLKLVGLGRIQRLLIIGLVKALRPLIVHTQTHTYQEYLQKDKIVAFFLPLISNIPIHNPTSIARNPVSIARVTKTFNFVVFGTVHPDALIEQFTTEVFCIAQQENWTVSLTVIGRQSPESDRWLTIWKEKGLVCTVLGEKSAEQVSQILSEATLGLSSTAFAVIEKSGSVAAMLAHGLPVLCIASDWKPRGISIVHPCSGVIEYKNIDLESALRLAEQSTMPVVTVSDIASSLINALQSSTNDLFDIHDLADGIS
ncbi:glycosyltransferase family protein [Spirosoma validum]|uniref:Glycosyltransferase family 4 protein n=1 Tax=Spirosoma validum TaxID=2771355 RepID=A0A927GD92_9BACT|nr:hypothetical protein [Spirosoma validum]MBD2753311.1 hypothetical protein [Spirosoma validum]